jgi:hypothetical protein
VLAFDKSTGALLWSTTVDTHPAAIVTQSATVFGGRVFVGVASQEEALALVPGYQLSFRGSMLALDLDTGAILWKTYMVPAGYTGGAVWGSSPAIDPKRGQVYIATGNNYSVPQPVLDCVAAAGSDSTAQAACLPPDDHFDSILALDMTTGAIRWANRAIPWSARDRRAVSTGSSMPTTEQFAGSPSPDPAARPAACNGARLSTARGSTRRTPTASVFRGRCSAAAERPPTAFGAGSMRRPAPCSGSTRRRMAAARPGLYHRQRRGVRLLARPGWIHVRAQRRYGCGTVELRQRWFVPLGRGDL